MPLAIPRGAGAGSPPFGGAEGWCYQHVQAITIAIDQYAKKTLGNRDYYLNKPYSIGGGRKDHVP
jgi:hypothetical protein